MPANTNVYANNDMEGEIKLHKRRWFFLAILALLQLLSGASYAIFGQINNFFVAFFRVTYVQVDWLTIAYDVTPIFLTIPFAFLAFKRLVGFRLIAIFCASTNAIAYTFFALSMLNRDLFAISIMGQLVNGISNQAVTITPSLFAAVWFPEHQVGTAIGVNILGYYFGYIIGLVVPSHAMALKFKNITTQNEHSMFLKDTSILTGFYTTCAAVSVTLVILLAVFSTDFPPSPPNRAQQLKRALPQTIPNSAAFWNQTKSILTNRAFAFVTFIFSIVLMLSTVEFTMMSQIIRNFGLDHVTSRNADIIGVYVMVTFSAGNIIGSVVGGKLVDLYKKYEILAALNMFLSFLSSIVIILGVYFAQYRLLYIGNTFLGFFGQIVMVVVFDISTQTTYPIDETVVSVWFGGLAIPMGIVYGEIGRVLFISFGGLAVVTFQSSLYFFGMLLAFFSSPQYGRIVASSTSEDDVGNFETTGLLSDKEHGGD